ncbi:MAG: hypothetical protein IKD90_03145 [Clostridiales bacterium]|nr:hypothetical protein [Clostridiales bacterium]
MSGRRWFALLSTFVVFSFFVQFARLPLLQIKTVSADTADYVQVLDVAGTSVTIENQKFNNSDFVFELKLQGCKDFNEANITVKFNEENCIPSINAGRHGVFYVDPYKVEPRHTSASSVSGNTVSITTKDRGVLDGHGKIRVRMILNTEAYLSSAAVVSVSPEPTPSPTPVPTNTPTPTPTNTPTPTKAPTNTPTPTKAPTNTPTPTKKPTNTPTPTKKPTNTPTPTKRPTNTPTPTKAPTNTPTPTKKPTNTPTPTKKPTNTPTPTKRPTNTPTPTKVPTNTPIPTKKPTNTPIPTGKPTNMPLPTQAPTNTPIPTQSPTNTPIPTATPLPTVVAPGPIGDPTATPEPTVTPEPTSTPSPVPEATPTEAPETSEESSAEETDAPTDETASSETDPVTESSDGAEVVLGVSKESGDNNDPSEPGGGKETEVFIPTERPELSTNASTAYKQKSQAGFFIWFAILFVLVIAIYLRYNHLAKKDMAFVDICKNFIPIPGRMNKGASTNVSGSTMSSAANGNIAPSRSVASVGQSYRPIKSTVRKEPGASQDLSGKGPDLNEK